MYFKRERSDTPKREERASCSWVLMESKGPMSCSDVLRASNTLSDIPGPKLGLTVVTHSPWFFLNSNLHNNGGVKMLYHDVNLLEDEILKSHL